jgi:nucleoside-diphosphate-sugar epimerase
MTKATYGGQSVLVTGGASFIGSYLVEQLLHHNASVTVVDDLSTGSEANLAAVANDVQLVRADVRNTSIVERAMSEHETVFHLAAIHGGRGFVDTHEFDCLANVALDNSVLRAAANSGVQRVVFASSACVYPTRLQDEAHAEYLLREQDADTAVTSAAESDGDYGRAKLIGELQLKSMQRERMIQATACRLFSVYGPRQSLSHSVGALIARALAQQDPYVIWGPGTQTRNFTHVEDTVRGLMLAGAASSAVDTVNIGTDTHIPVELLCEEIFKVIGWRPSEIVHDQRKPVGVSHRAADVNRAASIGWRAEVPLAAGLTETIDWYRNAGLGLTDDALFSPG